LQEDYRRLFDDYAKTLPNVVISGFALPRQVIEFTVFYGFPHLHFSDLSKSIKHL